MAKKEDELQKLVDAVGGTIAPTSNIDDTQQMLNSIKNAALIRAGIGIMGQRKIGESGYDVASRTISEVAKSSADQLKTYATVAAASNKKDDKKLTEFSKAQTIYNKTFYQPDAQTGALTQLRQPFMEQGITPPTQEWFKNNLLTDEFLLGGQGQGENYIDFHLGQAKRARDRGETPPDYEETFNTYNILRNTGR